MSSGLASFQPIGKVPENVSLRSSILLVKRQTVLSSWCETDLKTVPVSSLRRHWRSLWNCSCSPLWGRRSFTLYLAFFANFVQPLYGDLSRLASREEAGVTVKDCVTQRDSWECFSTDYMNNLCHTPSSVQQKYQSDKTTESNTLFFHWLVLFQIVKASITALTKHHFQILPHFSCVQHIWMHDSSSSSSNDRSRLACSWRLQLLENSLKWAGGFT